jgi:hypothetical protein
MSKEIEILTKEEKGKLSLAKEKIRQIISLEKEVNDIFKEVLGTGFELEIKSDE